MVDEFQDMSPGRARLVSKRVRGTVSTM